MIGQTLAHYKILEKIGSGGMGDVYMGGRVNCLKLDGQQRMTTLLLLMAVMRDIADDDQLKAICWDLSRNLRVGVVGRLK